MRGEEDFCRGGCRCPQGGEVGVIEERKVGGEAVWEELDGGAAVEDAAGSSESWRTSENVGEAVFLPFSLDGLPFEAG